MITFSALDISRIAEAKELPLLVREVATIITTEEPYLELKQLVKRISDADLTFIHTASDILIVDPTDMKMSMQAYRIQLLSTVTVLRMISTMLTLCIGEDYTNDEFVSRVCSILIHAFDLEFRSRCGLITYNHERLSIVDLDADLEVVTLIEDTPEGTEK